MVRRLDRGQLLNLARLRFTFSWFPHHNLDAPSYDPCAHSWLSSSRCCEHSRQWEPQSWKRTKFIHVSHLNQHQPVNSSSPAIQENTLNSMIACDQTKMWDRHIPRYSFLTVHAYFILLMLRTDVSNTLHSDMQDMTFPITWSVSLCAFYSLIYTGKLVDAYCSRAESERATHCSKNPLKEYPLDKQVSENKRRADTSRELI